MSAPSRRSPARGVAAVAAASLLLAGCSWLGVVPAGESDQNRTRVRCTSSYAIPLIDTTLAAAGAGGAIYLLSRDAPAKPFWLVASGLWALLYGVSAASGFAQVEECRAIKQFENENRHRRGDP
jgi:hypothetical protein